jgi:hypothetical protein
MKYKSVSGNQGVYSMSVVKRLLTNSKVKQLFALAKYGCCCCIEERTWIAALDLLGFRDEALSKYSMFQVWSNGMKNSILEYNTTKKYRSEDVYHPGIINSTEVLLNRLREAKGHGVLFARKFDSTNVESMKLRQWIIDELHCQRAGSASLDMIPL